MFQANKASECVGGENAASMQEKRTQTTCRSNMMLHGENVSDVGAEVRHFLVSEE